MQCVSLRPVATADEVFLLRLYASTRADELALTGWDRTTQEAFVRMQQTAQSRSYHSTHPHARCDVILVEQRAAGRLYVDRAGPEIHVLDISLLPEYRGRGIGTRLLTTLCDEAGRDEKRVTLNVERTNRAFGLYRRLGFEVTRADDVYLDLAWTPLTTAAMSGAARAGGRPSAS